MALCVMNPIEMNYKKIDKCALKLLGIGRFDLTDEEILECVSNYVVPKSIEGLLFDTFNNYYVLFLNEIDATCHLVGKKIEFKTFRINVYPLLECYLIDNVYPCLKNEELRDIFGTFGTVFSVTNHHLVPTSSKFAHVLSGKREITFLLPGKELEIYIPINVVHPPYSFNVHKFCCACLTEGHSMLYCPDIEDIPEIKQDYEVDSNRVHDSDSDSELEALIKSEGIYFEDTKVEDSLPDTQSSRYCFRSIEKIAAGETSRQRDEPEIAKASPEIGDEIKPDEAVSDASQEEEHPKSEIANNDNLTQVVSTSKVCRFTPGMQLIKRRSVKSACAWLPPLGKELINEVCGSYIIEANVFKQLVLTDGRLKTEIIKFGYSYLDDMSHLLKLMKKVMKLCYRDKKYASLRGPFSSKVRRIYDVLSAFGKKK